MLEAISQSGILTALVFFVVWVGIWVPVAIPLAIALRWRPPQPVSPTQKLPLVLTLYALAPLVLWGAIWLTQSDWTLYGWSANERMWRSCLLGTGFGAIALLMVYAAQVWLGWLTLVLPTANPQDEKVRVRPILINLALTLAIALIIGAVEELIFRGFLLHHLQMEYGPLGAAIASSAIFAALHLIWDGRQGLWQLPGLWLMGIALVLARGADQGQLGLPWGLHAGWVWVVASVDSLQGIPPTGKAPTWVTGVEDQPLAGVVGIGFMLVMTLALYSLQQIGLRSIG